MESNQPPAPHRARPGVSPSPQPANRHPDQPWRTEGLPGGEDDDKTRRSRWLRATVITLVFYALVFALLTWQDIGNDPVAISYTAFTEQVKARNVARTSSGLPGRHCWPGPPQGRPECRSSPPAPRSSSR